MKFRIGIALALSLGAVLVVGASMSSSATRSSAAAGENAVVVWSGIAETAIAAPPPGSTSPRPPASSSVLAGMVHGAIYDAVAATEGDLDPFATGVSAPPGASTDAAVARAALDVLKTRVPGQATTVQAAYDTFIATIPEGRRRSGQEGHRGRRCCRGRHACAADRRPLRRCRPVRAAADWPGRVPTDRADATGRHQAAARAPVHVLGTIQVPA